MLRRAAQRTQRANARRLLSTQTASTSSSTYEHAAFAGTAPTTADPIGYCRDIVRKHDYESFLGSQLYPHDLRGGFFALKAFAVELAMVQDVVSNPVIGKMRMQFWRDTVKDISSSKEPKHPIGSALYQTSQRQKLSSYHLKRIVDARDAEIDTPSHLTLTSLTSHAESTSSTLLYLLLSLLSQSSSDNLSHAASHLGIAQTLTTLLRALPYHASKGRMVIPAEITAKHKVNQDEVFRKGGNANGIEDAVFEFATIANDHMCTAREMVLAEGGGKVPSVAIPVFIGAIPVVSYLERLEKANFDAFEGSLQVRDWKLPWKVWKSSLRQQI